MQLYMFSLFSFKGHERPYGSYKVNRSVCTEVNRQCKYPCRLKTNEYINEVPVTAILQLDDCL